jgi:hypothetical protein
VIFRGLLDARTVCRTCGIGCDSNLTPSEWFGVIAAPRVEVKR